MICLIISVVVLRNNCYICVPFFINLITYPIFYNIVTYEFNLKEEIEDATGESDIPEGSGEPTSGGADGDTPDIFPSGDGSADDCCEGVERPWSVLY